ncbi:hypothetical protein [Streptomyces spectabilis]|uniref:Uncharacterized protein n=1 Tax=Streptomyces spectabilis TaxID=68270 RepID=A0A7W8EXF1_STRST|nr:hypothetical protein [Streptomyces spectabilis]MBB5109017.1 hypothetical protein [Streptomyces spectabilis]GGV50682.1 hypothetical protein GCM10010245_79890 [Streptomyces spectabilis]
MPGTTLFPPRSAELTAADLTLADVESLTAYLQVRLDGVRDRHSLSSDEWRTALALGLAVSGQARRVRDTFADDSAELLRARRRQWNQLVILAAPWDSAAGYDTARWCDVQHVDVAEAAKSAAIRRSLL